MATNQVLRVGKREREREKNRSTQLFVIDFIDEFCNDDKYIFKRVYNNY
jgi:hypothetical protein